MCGIGLCVCTTSAEDGEETISPCESCPVFDRTNLLQSRGPDCYDTHLVQVSPNTHIHFASAVLSLRGDDICVQPSVDSCGNVLLFNGEVYRADGFEVNLADTEYVLRRLAQCSSDEAILTFLNTLHGPWALVYWSQSRKTVYYGRDRVGRRSLLEAASHGHTYIASVAIESDTLTRAAWERVPVEGVYWVKFAKGEVDRGVLVWPQTVENIHSLKHGRWPRIFEQLKLEQDGGFEARLLESALGLMDVLQDAVHVRVECVRPVSGQISEIPRIAVLFSGGIDCTILAALAHLSLPNSEPVELINVCFDKDRNHSSPDRLQAIECFTELVEVFPSRDWRLVLVDSSFEEVKIHAHHILQLCYPNKTHMDFNIGAALWFASRGKGVLFTRKDIQRPYVKDEEKASAHLRALLRENLSETFRASSEKTASQTSSSCHTLNCRKLAKPRCCNDACKSCCLKLQASANMRCPVHKRKQHKNAPKPTPEWPTYNKASSLDAYTCRARVLLSGLGADEQLGGYGRHRQAFKYRGWTGLQEELDVDVTRIWSRNLGRDDRCCSDHGKEVRHPFLDESVLDFIRNRIPLQHKVNYAEARSVGDKRLLRLISHALGLTGPAMYEKRAIQFGTRLAKLSNINCFGSNRAYDGTVSFALD